MVWLESFGFPGNVRQLENICHWVTVMAPAQMIEPKDLPPEVIAARTQGELEIASLIKTSLAPIPVQLHAPAPALMPDAFALKEPVFNKTDILEMLSQRDAQQAKASEVSNTPSLHTPTAEEVTGKDWEDNLEAEALALLNADCKDVWDMLTRRFESRMIKAALNHTQGRRIEAAIKLGIGRNTVSRKIQELGL